MTKVLADDKGISEKQLVQLSQQGDRTSFRHLYRRYHQRVRSTLYQLCGQQMLDDLVQEVFLRVWKGLPKLRNSSYFSTWLYRITWNVAQDQRKQYGKMSAFEADISSSETLNYYLDTKSVERPNLLNLHYQDLVKRGLQSLSLEQRAVLVLHDLEDLPQKEVAKILDIPLGTVKSRLFNGRNAMKKFLQQEEEII
jgi:RNA polymerase sigma-70 factor (ECF subfamily)